MSDALDRLASAAGPLLRRVDATLAELGAAADDPVWSLLRTVRALPSEAVAAVARWRPGPVETAAAPLPALRRRYGEVLDGLPRHAPWEGAGADAYGRAWATLRDHVLRPEGDSLVGRLRDTETYLEATAAWIRRARRTVATALAEVLGSAEAVVLVTGAEPPGPAAACVGAHVLAPVAAAADEGRQLHDDWRARLTELPLPPVGVAAGGRPGPLRIPD